MTPAVSVEWNKEAGLGVEGSARKPVNKKPEEQHYVGALAPPPPALCWSGVRCQRGQETPGHPALKSLATNQKEVSCLSCEKHAGEDMNKEIMLFWSKDLPPIF